MECGAVQHHVNAQLFFSAQPRGFTPSAINSQALLLSSKARKLTAALQCIDNIFILIKPRCRLGLE